MDYNKIMTKIQISLVLISLIALLQAHPTIHDNFPRSELCVKGKPAKPHSWHLHVIFDIEQRDAADAFKEKFAEFLGVQLEDPDYECHNIAFIRKHKGKKDLCFFETDYAPGAGSPWNDPEWAILFYPQDFERMTTWGLQNKGDLDLVIHPNTICAIEDHTWWVIYAGKQRTLDISIFGPGEKPIYRDTSFVTTEEALASGNVSDRLKAFLRKHDH